MWYYYTCDCQKKSSLKSIFNYFFAVRLKVCMKYRNWCMAVIPNYTVYYDIPYNEIPYL